MKITTAIAAIFLAAINFAGAQTADTNAVPRTPREGDIVPAPGPRDRAYGISGPGAKHTAQWTNYNSQCTGSAVRDGLIPNLKPLIPDTQLRDTIVILGGDGNYCLTGSSGADIWDFNDGIELWRSADLKKWDYVGEVWSFDKNGTWEKNWLWHRKPVRAIWAPEIHYIKRLNNYFHHHFHAAGQSRHFEKRDWQTGRPVCERRGERRLFSRAALTGRCLRTTTARCISPAAALPPSC